MTFRKSGPLKGLQNKISFQHDIYQGFNSSFRKLAII